VSLAGLISSMGSITTSARSGCDCEGFAGIGSPNQRRRSHRDGDGEIAVRESV
jgi:hypothetical protein